MARPRKPIEELTGKRSMEHWEERVEQDEIYQAQFSDEVQALTTREMQQIGKFGEKLFPQFKELLESRKLYNDTADRMALISLLTYLRTKDELLSYLNCSGIDDTLNYIKSLNQIDRMIDNQMKNLQLTPEMRNKIKDGDFEFNINQDDLQSIINEVMNND